jgi:MFS family permease
MQETQETQAPYVSHVSHVSHASLEGARLAMASTAPMVAPSPHLPRRELLALSLAWFAPSFISAALLPLVIPAQIALYIAPGGAGGTGNARQALTLGLAAAVSAVITLTLQPLVGAASDRLRTPLGRRLPFIAGGGVMALMGLALLALTHAFALFACGLILTLVANAVTSSASQGLIADCVPGGQRGVASGYVGLMTLFGTAGSFVVAALALSHFSGGATTSDGLAHGASVFYGIGAIALFACVGLTLLTVNENSLAQRCREASRLSTVESSHDRHVTAPLPAPANVAPRGLSPWRSANFRWVFLTRGAVMLGLALFMTYVEYYFARVEHLTNFVQATGIVIIVALVSGVGSAVAVGALSDRIGRRAPVVCVAGAAMAVAALLFVVMPTHAPLLILGILFGVGYGAFMSVDMALAVDVLPSAQNAGKDLGIWSIASTLPLIVAPALGSLVILLASDLGQLDLGYRALFGLAAVFLALGSLLALNVRERAPERSNIVVEVVRSNRS